MCLLVLYLKNDNVASEIVVVFVDVNIAAIAVTLYCVTITNFVFRLVRAVVMISTLVTSYGIVPHGILELSTAFCVSIVDV